jgi:GH18 family chitinase
MKIVKLKELSKDLKVFLAIGGWDIKSYGFNEAANPKDPNVTFYSLNDRHKNFECLLLFKQKVYASLFITTYQFSS